MDLDRRRYGTFADLRLYCHRAASVVGRMCVQVFGHRGARALALADELGVAFQLTNILRDLREDALRGRVYLPQEDLMRFGVEERDLLASSASDPLRRLLAFEAARANEHFERAAPLLGLVDRKSQRALAGMRAMYRALLRKIERRGYDVLADRVRLGAHEKLLVAARAWIGAR
jgi:15-cis-phytoene synthase